MCFSDGIIANEWAHSNFISQASRIIPGTQTKKNVQNPTRETGNNLMRRKLFTLVTRASRATTPMSRFDRVAHILFWHEKAKVNIIKNLEVSCMAFQKILLFWVAKKILET